MNAPTVQTQTNAPKWLVIEPWITPSLFDNTGNNGIVDEWTFAAYQDRNKAQAALQQHWDTFYTENDFAQIAGECGVHP
ncbi:hypothetical protein Q0O39_13890, partial [Staphylococcus aureus]|nr:hypothetical protein [Staphylococcus aureus]